MDTLRRILIVDDEADFTAMTAMALEGTGKYQVRQVNAASGVLAMAREFCPHLILLDVAMPDQDGGEVLLNLESDAVTAKVPVVFLTALVAGRESPTGSLTRGGRRFLPKPLSLDSLASTINEVLGDPQRPHSRAF